MADAVSFFDAPVPAPLRDLAQRMECNIRDGDDDSVLITSVGPLEAAGQGALTFLNSGKYVKALAETEAAAVICSSRYADKVPAHISAVIAEQPYQAFAKAAAWMFPKAMRPQPMIEPGIAPGALVHPSASLEDDVTVEHGAVVGPGAHVGRGSIICPGAVVGPNVRLGRETSVGNSASVTHAIIGDRVFIHSGVRIGGDGFGYAMGPTGHAKIPQIGRVVIQDDVEIGPNSCIDRGSNRDTIVGEGTKIDNLVMIGHNVVIGRHCVIVGQVGIAGSTEIGNFVILGGKAAINGHIKIGDGCQIAGLSGVSGDVPPGSRWGGVPARPIKHWMREIARLRREAFSDTGTKEGRDE